MLRRSATTGRTCAARSRRSTRSSASSRLPSPSGPPPAAETEADAATFHEIGDLLFTVVNVGRHLNVDPELALRATSERFVERVERASEIAAEEGRDWSGLGLDEQDAYYERAKESLV